MWTGDQSDVFELWVNSVSGTATRVIHDTAITGTSFTATNDLADGDYFAWVRRRPASGPAGPWTSAYSFVITSAGIPGAAEITNIANANSGLPVFSWSAIENAARIELWCEWHHNECAPSDSRNAADWAQLYSRRDTASRNLSSVDTWSLGRQRRRRLECGCRFRGELTYWRC